ncbi:hypothetical protein [Bacillus sp. EB600]|uniref:hypothetical protein n=1 Tax=Bacillus sp. EB600 TaxID=2806345 RepID=UPI00210865AD|nr:hypothetical protein [Bacillus sp. EB600]MCQ6281807.1 hypothetical protein [Bacillus sp. EB600]
MVYQSIRNLLKSKKSFPFAAVTTSLLFLNIGTAKATALQDHYQTVSNNNSSIFSFSHLGFLDNTKSIYLQTQEFYNQIHAVNYWFTELPVHIAQWSVNLLTWIYELISALILQTPLWLFKNTWFIDTSLVFSSISIGVIIILTSFESIKQILKRKHSDFAKILKRLPFAIIGAGAAPYLFQKTYELLNLFSQSITKIGASEIRSEDFMTASKLSGIDTAALIGFDIILILILIPLILHTGRRWFDLITLGVMTPLALTCWIFDDYRYLFNMWWSNIKHLSLVQLVYASFICVMGIFIFGTRNVIEGNGFYMKLLVVIGGLWRMANPPGFVVRNGDSGKDVTHIYRDLKHIFTKKTLLPVQNGKGFLKKLKTKPPK